MLSETRDYFFVVTDIHGHHEVMSEKEIEETPDVTLASGRCDTHAEAERLLKEGLADGSYSQR